MGTACVVEDLNVGKAMRSEAWKMCFSNQGLCFLGPYYVSMSLRILSRMKHFKVISNTGMGRRFWSQHSMRGGC